jgi:LysM repeat protein
MKILRIFGVVVGIHALVLILIFADPGCSVGRSQPAASDTSAPPASSPITPAPTEPSAPISFSPGSASGGSGLYAPTRPGTPAAAALEAQPVADVTPAVTYAVASGDSLWSIAKRNHLKISDLATANNLHVGSVIHPGQKLIIPGKPLTGTTEPGALAAQAWPAKVRASAKGSADVRYVVRPGESLRTIARKFHVKLSAIAAANSISDPKTIHAGQELVIPGAHGSAANATAPKPVAEAAPPAEAPAVPDATPQVPTAQQDLDAGLKPAAGGDVPVVKVDDASSPQK